MSQGDLAHDAAHRDESEEHAEEDEEEVVGGVYGSEPYAEGDADEELALAGDLQAARELEAAA
jgi:hypothetical protein